MKVKTSITLSRAVLRAIDERAEDRNRSEFIETALLAHLARLTRDEQNAHDLRILNEKAEALNEEALDVLAYQVKI